MSGLKEHWTLKGQLILQNRLTIVIKYGQE